MNLSYVGYICGKKKKILPYNDGSIFFPLSLYANNAFLMHNGKKFEKAVRMTWFGRGHSMRSKISWKDRYYAPLFRQEYASLSH